MPTINLGKIRLNWLGDWSNATAYSALDAVAYNGNSYVATADSTNQAPETAGVVNSSYWDKMAEGATQMTTLGDLAYYGTSGVERLPIGGAGQVLTASGTNEPVWAIQAALPTHRAAYQMPHWHDELDRQSMNWGITYASAYLASDRRSIYACGRIWHGSTGQAFGDAIIDEIRSGYQPVVLQEPLEANDYIEKLFQDQQNMFFYTNQGYIYGTGNNGVGQLGQGDTTSRRYFVRVPGFGGNQKLARKMMISGEDSIKSVYVLDENGQIWDWGYNSYGALGDGTTTQRTSPVTPTNVTGLTFVNFWAGGAYGSMVYALTNTGDLWAWGSNRAGMAGDSTWNNDKTTPIQTSLTDVEDVWTMTYRTTWHGVGGVPGGFTIVKKTDGTMHATGANYYGNLADGTSTNRQSWQAMTIPAGKSVSKYYITGRDYATSYMITTDGYLYVIGAGNYGKAINGTTTANSTGFVQAQLPAGFQGNVTDVVALGGGSYGTVWIRAYSVAGGERWASAGYHGYGVIGDGTESTANTTNHSREITNYMPWVTDNNQSGWKHIQMRSHDNASLYEAYVQMNDGQIYVIGENNAYDKFSLETINRNTGHFSWRRAMRQ